MLQVGDIRLDPEGRTLFYNGDATTLTKTETRLLGTLMQRPGEVVTTQALMKEVWDTDYLGDLGTLYFYVYSLRRKIGSERIATHPRLGYALLPQSAGFHSKDS